MKRYSIGLAAVVLLVGVGQVGATVWTFTNAGATGQLGPTQTQVDAAYAATNLTGLVTSTGGIQSWSIPTTGIYRITAWGAQGASGSSAYVGGNGAMMAADFNLTAGQVIRVAVGQMGIGQSSGSNGGGGGGSFVVDPSSNPLVVAGGGGGTRAGAGQNGHPGQVVQNATTASGSSSTGGGALKTVGVGLGGIISASSYGSAGGGFYGNGADDGTYGTGGKWWANGLVGGAAVTGGGINAYGGFGGGGAGNGSYGGGGGGGFSGGDGGFIAGGAGSYVIGINQFGAAGSNAGDGLVLFELVSTPIPEPSTLAIWSLLGLCSIAIGWRLRRKAA